MVFEKLKLMVCEQLDVDADNVTEESLIYDDLGADSLDIFDLILEVQKEFDIEVSEDSIENILTIGDIVRYIESEIK